MSNALRNLRVLCVSAVNILLRKFHRRVAENGDCAESESSDATKSNPGFVDSIGRVGFGAAAVAVNVHSPIMKALTSWPELARIKKGFQT
jgi:hypothetical protein